MKHMGRIVMMVVAVVLMALGLAHVAQAAPATPPTKLPSPAAGARQHHAPPSPGEGRTGWRWMVPSAYHSRPTRPHSLSYC